MPSPNPHLQLRHCEACGVKINSIAARPTGHRANYSRPDGFICQECYEEKYSCCAYDRALYPRAECKKCIITDDTFGPFAVQSGQVVEVPGEGWVTACFTIRTQRTGECMLQEDYRHRMFVCRICAIEHDLRTGEERAPDGNGNVCASCRGRLFTCPGCQHREFVARRQADGNCARCHEEENRVVHQYSYKPAPAFKHLEAEVGNTNNVYFGCELEMECAECQRGMDTCNDELAKKIRGKAYLKHDGSLHHGVEMVSHPMTWAWLNDHAEWWRNLLAWLRAEGYRSWDTTTCGLHIHVTRNLSQLHERKLRKFIYTNPRLVHDASGRAKNALQTWATLYGVKHADKNTPNRRIALNLLNRNTIEFRVFKGTLNFDSFMRAFEFVRASVEFTRTAGIRSLSAEAFKDYIADPAFKADYKRLHKLLVIEDLPVFSG